MADIILYDTTLYYMVGSGLVQFHMEHPYFSSGREWDSFVYALL